MTMPSKVPRSTPGRGSAVATRKLKSPLAFTVRTMLCERRSNLSASCFEESLRLNWISICWTALYCLRTVGLYLTYNVYNYTSISCFSVFGSSRIWLLFEITIWIDFLENNVIRGNSLIIFSRFSKIFMTQNKFKTRLDWYHLYYDIYVSIHRNNTRDRSSGGAPPRTPPIVNISSRNSSILRSNLIKYLALNWKWILLASMRSIKYSTALIRDNEAGREGLIRGPQ